MVVSTFRRRREYLSMDISELLAKQDVDSNLLIPRHQSSVESTAKPNNPAPSVLNYLPLEVCEMEKIGLYCVCLTVGLP